MPAGWIVPDWQSPPNVRALTTTRVGGFSEGPYQGLNLGLHVGDDPQVVARNRALLKTYLPDEPMWLEQVHSTQVVNADEALRAACIGDAVIARRGNVVCPVLTADCLPVLLCDDAGSVVAAAHAGWRGLVAGVLERTVAAMAVPPGRVCAWLGPAIGPRAFEVGNEVRSAFIDADPRAASAFVPGAASGKWFADLFALARQRLDGVGVRVVSGGDLCTVADPERFYSYRRDGVTGRFASMIWIAA